MFITKDRGDLSVSGWWLAAVSVILLGISAKFLAKNV